MIYFGGNKMYCRNCGAPMDNRAIVCVKCGVRAGDGVNFCPNCGSHTEPYAPMCLNCGIALNPEVFKSDKSKLVTLLLAIFLGSLGIHNFYLGYIKQGVIQLVLSCAFCWTFIVPTGMWVWALVQGIQAYEGKIPDAEGRTLAD